MVYRSRILHLFRKTIHSYIIQKLSSFIVPTEFRFQSHENEITPGFIHSMMYIYVI